jgi:adenylate cyclase
VAKVRLPWQSLAVLGFDVAADDLAALEDLYDDTAPVRTSMVCESHLNLAAPEEEPRWQAVFASFYREGILFAHQSLQAPSETFLELLSRRDQLIRTVVADRKPVLTPVCTLVARLQDAVKFCAELPPEEYFELINQVRQACEGVLRNNHATQGQHAGDGIVFHFSPSRTAITGAMRFMRRVRSSKSWRE